MTIDRSTEKQHQEAIRLMENFLAPEIPKLGIFWYDYKREELFGVEKQEVTEEQMRKGMHTLPKLHRSYWQKWHHRAVAKNDTSSIYYQEHNYTLIPRGRIFLTEGVFTVRVGEWIIDGIDGHKIDPEKLHDLICDEFDIPEDFQFIIDEHWNLGHGWSERDNLLDPKAKIFTYGKETHLPIGGQTPHEPTPHQEIPDENPTEEQAARKPRGFHH